MNKTELMNNLTRSIHTVGFQLKKHSPEIMVVAGTIGVIASAVMACRATTKLSAVLEESKNNINEIHGYVEQNGYSEKYTEEDYKKDITITYAHTGLKLVKLYAPAVVLGGLSLASIITSHHILNKRNVALAAAYTTVDTSFKDYRKRVVERFGEELDKELKYNIKAREIEEVTVEEDGTEKKVRKVVNTAEPSDYARFFDEYCEGWTKNPELNLTFLKLQQSHANRMLQERGYLYLNEVYEMLGIKKTGAGQVVGWIYDENDATGDNYVDFGIYDLYDERKRSFVNGYERSILLDFNVDGNIIDLMP